MCCLDRLWASHCCVYCFRSCSFVAARPITIPAIFFKWTSIERRNVGRGGYLFLQQHLPLNIHCCGTARLWALPGFLFTISVSSMATVWPWPPIGRSWCSSSAEQMSLMNMNQSTAVWWATPTCSCTVIQHFASMQQSNNIWSCLSVCRLLHGQEMTYAINIQHRRFVQSVTTLPLSSLHSWGCVVNMACCRFFQRLHVAYALWFIIVKKIFYMFLIGVLHDSCSDCILLFHNGGPKKSGHRLITIMTVSNKRLLM